MKREREREREREEIHGRDGNKQSKPALMKEKYRGKREDKGLCHKNERVVVHLTLEKIIIGGWEG